MKKVMVAVLMTSFLLTWPSSGLAADSAEDSIYYTRVGFFHEKGTHKTTNYLRGFFVPINTEVKILKKTQRSIYLRIVDRDEEIRIANLQGHSGEKIDAIFERMFSLNETDLTSYSSEQVERIMAGVFELGMTKEEIILAIGYPPKHRTSSLVSNKWRYWESRFDTVLLHFKSGVLEHIDD